MAVAVEPAAIQIPATGGSVVLVLTNSNAKVRFAFKVNSSNNDYYRVNPVFGFVEPGAAAQIEVTRQKGPPQPPFHVDPAQGSVEPGAATQIEVICQNGPPKGDDKLEICFAGAPLMLVTPRLCSLLDRRVSSR